MSQVVLFLFVLSVYAMIRDIDAIAIKGGGLGSSPSLSNQDVVR